MAGEAHIRVQDLTLAYGDFVIQRDLTFDVRRGDILVSINDEKVSSLEDVIRIASKLDPDSEDLVRISGTVTDRTNFNVNVLDICLITSTPPNVRMLARSFASAGSARPA